MLASLILALHFGGLITIQSAISSLYVAGILLLIAEIGVISFGLIAINGLISLYAAYSLQTGTLFLLGTPVGWNILFGIVFVEIAIITSVIIIHLWIRNQKHTTGIEGMIGEKAVITSWSGTKGSITYEGEKWAAESKIELELNPEDEVIIDFVDKLKLFIKT